MSTQEYKEFQKKLEEKKKWYKTEIFYASQIKDKER